MFGQAEDEDRVKEYKQAALDKFLRLKNSPEPMVAQLFFLTRFKGTTCLERLSDTLLWVDKLGAETSDWRELKHAITGDAAPKTFDDVMGACADHLEGTSLLKLVPDVLHHAGVKSAPGPTPSS